MAALGRAWRLLVSFHGEDNKALHTTFYQSTRLCMTPRFLTRHCLGLWSRCPDINVLGSGRKWDGRQPGCHLLTTSLNWRLAPLVANSPLRTLHFILPSPRLRSKHGHTHPVYRSVDYPGASSQMGEFPEIPARILTWPLCYRMLVSCCPSVAQDCKGLFTTWKVQNFQITPDPTGKTIFSLIYSSRAMLLLSFIWLSLLTCKYYKLGSQRALSKTWLASCTKISVSNQVRLTSLMIVGWAGTT